MSKRNRRVVVSLSNFLNDHRSTVLIYLSRRLRYIRDLEEHVGGLFGIADFYFTSGNRYLPSTEDIRILHPEELLKVIPKPPRREGPQLNKPGEACLEPPAPQNAFSIQEALAAMDNLFRASEDNKKAKPLFDDANSKEQDGGDAKHRRDSPLPSSSSNDLAYSVTPKMVCDENKTFRRAEMGPSNSLSPGNVLASLETSKMACNENKRFQARMGPSNFEDEAQGAPPSPSTAIVEQVFNFLERPEMTHSENDANLNRPRLDAMEFETPSTPPELDGGVKCLTLKNANAKEKKSKSAASSNKIESKVIKGDEKWKTTSIEESYLLTRTWPHLDKTKTKTTQVGEEKVAATNKRPIAKEEGAQDSFKTRPVSVKKRKTDLMCVKLPKQTNIVKSLIVSGAPKLLHNRECQSVTTESQRKPETNQNAISAIASQIIDKRQAQLEVNPEFQSAARSAISGATLQATDSRRKLERSATSQLTDDQWKLKVSRSPTRRATSVTISRTMIGNPRKLETDQNDQTTHDQTKSEVKPERQGPACNAISAIALQATDSRLKLEQNQSPASIISQTIESRRKPEANHSPACSAISAITLQTTDDGRLKLKENQSPSSIISQTIESRRKPEANHSPARSAISAITLQTINGRLTLKKNQSPASITSQIIESQRKLEVANHSQTCSAISAITDGQLKLQVKPEFHSPAVSQLTDSQLKLEVKPEIPSPSVNAISASSLQTTTDGQWKLEMKPEFQSPLCKSHATDNQSKPEVKPAAATCVTTPQEVVEATMLSTDQNRSATKYSEVERKQLPSALDQEEKESTTSSALLSNSDSDRNNSSGNKRKRKRHRKRKDKGKAAPQPPPVNDVRSFKPPSTIAAPSMHIRFDEPDVNAEEAGPPSKETAVEEERQTETNGVVEEISDLEGEMMERVVRQSPRMTKTLPRAGDVVSFKFLRLNVNYEPEVSKTIIGKVLDFTADTDQVHMHLISGVDQCQEPDGKFSLEDDDGGGGAAVITEKSFPWKSLLEPRLLFP